MSDDPVAIGTDQTTTLHSGLEYVMYDDPVSLVSFPHRGELENLTWTTRPTQSEKILLSKNGKCDTDNITYWMSMLNMELGIQTQFMRSILHHGGIWKNIADLGCWIDLA